MAYEWWKDERKGAVPPDITERYFFGDLSPGNTEAVAQVSVRGDGSIYASIFQPDDDDENDAFEDFASVEEAKIFVNTQLALDRFVL